MKFRTEIDPPRAPFSIDHSSAIFVTGSCFAEHITERLRKGKFSVCGNPSGILFNPLSIGSMFEDIASGKVYTEADLNRSDNGLWFSYSHHGSFSRLEQQTILGDINLSLQSGKEAFEKTDTVIVTFGTAWVFRLADSGRVVANCHKQPSSCFVRERLSVEETVAVYRKLLMGVLKDKRVIFTLSPVRHLGDGAEGNSLSKAILRVAIGELVGEFDNAFYFPSYEIVLDDLRDYRFYARDLVHPSDMAVDYVWQKFTEWCMPERTRVLLPEIDKLRMAMSHRPLHDETMASEAFYSKMADRAESLSREFPGLDLTEEKAFFNCLRRK